MKQEIIPFGRGMLTEGPLLSRPPGTCLIATNFEIPPQGGYRRINGYELFDGSDAPVAPPGSGEVRGVFIYKDEYYCIRDNAGATAGVIYKATPSGWSLIDDTLPAGGSYEFLIYNFYASTDNIKVYGVNGVGKAFEFDGTSVSFITTGMTLDIPTHIAQFKKFLFLSFSGGSVQHSAAGDPSTWSPILGASELGVGDDVTGFSTETGGSLVIFSRNKTHILTGTGEILSSGVLDWTLVEFSSESGAIENSINRLGQTLYLDDRGLTALRASDTFGDFAYNAYSAGFRPLVSSYYKLGVRCSTVIKENNQYRIFFNNGQALCCSFQGLEFVGATTFDFPITVAKVFTWEVNSIEKTIIGDTEGNVYLLDSGNNFNGVAIRSYLKTQFYHYGSPVRRKRFRRVHIEAESEGNSVLSFQPEFSYSSPNIKKAIIDTFLLVSSGGLWDKDSWNEFMWAIPLAGNTPVRINGVGANMSALFFHESENDSPFILYGMIVDFDDRGVTR